MIKIMKNGNRLQVFIKIGRTKNILELLVIKKKQSLFMISTGWENKRKRKLTSHIITIKQ